MVRKYLRAFGLGVLKGCLVSGLGIFAIVFGITLVTSIWIRLDLLEMFQIAVAVGVLFALVGALAGGIANCWHEYSAKPVSAAPKF